MILANDLCQPSVLGWDDDDVINTSSSTRTTHAPCHAPTHAWPSLPVNQNPNPAPTEDAISVLHGTAAPGLRV